MRLFDGFFRVAEDKHPVAKSAPTPSYADYLEQIADADAGLPKAAGILALFGAMKKNGSGLWNVFSCTPNSELQEAILKTEPLLVMTQNPNNGVYYAPNKDSSSLDATQSVAQARDAWIYALRRVNQFAMSSAYSTHMKHDKAVA